MTIPSKLKKYDVVLQALKSGANRFEYNQNARRVSPRPSISLDHELQCSTNLKTNDRQLRLQLKMPHSVSPEPSHGDDVEVPGPPVQPAEEIPATELDSASQHAGEVKAQSSGEPQVKQTSVEDIFDDDDGDEFSSSAQVVNSSQEPMCVSQLAQMSIN